MKIFKTFHISLTLFFALAVNALQGQDLGSWSPPVTLEGSFSHNLSLAMDAQGNAIALWIHYDETGSWIKGATKKAGKSWSTPFLLTSQAPLDAFGPPEVKFDSSNNAIALWTIDEGTATSVQMAYLPYGTTTWKYIQTPFSSSDKIQGGVEFAIDREGDVFVCWNSTKFTTTDVFVSARFLKQSQSWQTIENIVTNYAIDYRSLALDSAGNAVLVWNEQRHSYWFGDTVLAATLPKDAVAWSTPTLLYSGTESWFTTVAVDSEGNALAVWQGLDSKKEHWSIECRRLSFGANSWEKIEIPGSTVSAKSHASYCKLCMDPAGNALVVWEYPFISGFQSSKFLADELRWTTPLPIPTQSESSKYESLGIDASGNALFIFQEGYESLKAIGLPSSNKAWWSKPIEIAPIHALDEWPMLAFSSDGSCTVMYCESINPSLLVKSSVGTNIFKRAIR